MLVGKGKKQHDVFCGGILDVKFGVRGIEQQLRQTEGCNSQPLVDGILVHQDQAPVWIRGKEFFSQAHHVELWQRLLVKNFELSQESVEKTEIIRAQVKKIIAP